VGEEEQHHPERRARPLLERKKRVGCGAREEGTRRLPGEAGFRHRFARTKGDQAKASERERMTWDMGERAEHLSLEPFPVGEERLEQTPVRTAVFAKRCCRVVHRAMHEDRATVVEWMCERRRRVDELQSEVQRAKEGRRGAERVDGRADVVPEARKRQLARACATPDGVLRFQDQDRPAGLSESDRGREAVRPRADDDRV
jgi:hypothetical protein